MTVTVSAGPSGSLVASYLPRAAGSFLIRVSLRGAAVREVPMRCEVAAQAGMVGMELAGMAESPPRRQVRSARSLMCRSTPRLHSALPPALPLHLSSTPSLLPFTRTSPTFRFAISVFGLAWHTASYQEAPRVLPVRQIGAR